MLPSVHKQPENYQSKIILVKKKKDTDKTNMLFSFFLQETGESMKGKQVYKKKNKLKNSVFKQ